MTWAKLDDRYDDHRKTKRAWRLHRATIGLHTMAITYCARHELDGVVDIEWITDKLPATKEREKVLAALVECRLFDPIDADHYRVHDYLDHNPSRAQLETRRRSDAERKAKGRQAQSQETPAGVQPESDGPIPSHPTPALEPPNPQGGNDDLAPPIEDTAPIKPAGARGRDQGKYDAAMAAWCGHHFPEASDPRAVRSVIVWSRLPEPVTADDLRTAALSDPLWAAQLGLNQEAA